MKKRFYQLGKQVLSLSVVIASTLLFSNQVSAQGVSINGTGTSTAPDASAILDLNVSGLTPKKGFLAPRVALTGSGDATTITSPATSLIVYNTATGGGVSPGFYYNSGTPGAPSWVSIGGSGSAPTAGNDINVSGTQVDVEPILNYVNTITSTDGGGTGVASDLTILGPAFQNLILGAGGLEYGRFSSTSPGLFILGVPSTTTGTLRFGHSGSANTVSIASGATTTSYSLTLPLAQGSAGQTMINNGSGVLTWGTPTISGNAALTNGTIWIGNASNIATEQTMSGDVTMTNAGVTTIQDNSVDGTDIALGTQANNDLMQYNGTDWVAVAPSSLPLVTSFSAGTTGLTPNTATTGAVTLAGTLIVGNGGTGATTLTGMLKGNGTSPVTGVTGTQWGAAYWSDANTIAATAAGTTGQLLRATTGGAPTWSNDIPASDADYIWNQITAAQTAPSNFWISNIGKIDGSLQLKGTAANYTTITSAATGNYTLTLPVDDGNANQVLATNGTGTLSWATPMTNPMDEIGDIIFGSTATNPSTPDDLSPGTAGRTLHTNGVGNPPTWAVIDLDNNPNAEVGGILGVGNGGTGVANPTANGILVGNGTSPVTSLTGTNMQTLRFNATPAPVASSNLLNNDITVGIGGLLPADVTASSAKLDVYGDNTTTLSLQLRSGDNQNAQLDASTYSTQIAFGWSGTTDFRHNIRTRHNSLVGTSNAIDFYLWKPGVDANAALGTNRVFTIFNDGTNSGVELYGGLYTSGAWGTVGQVLASGGTGVAPTWVNAATGTVTSITPGTGIVGSAPITTTGTITVDAANGLTSDAGEDKVELGGTLDETTTIAQAGFAFNMSGGAINLNDAAAANATNIGTGTTTGAVTIGGTGTQTISVGNGAAAKTVNIGSSNTTSTTTILSGSGAVNINAANSQPTNINSTAGNTGNVVIGNANNYVGIGGAVNASYKLTITGKVKSTGINETSDARLKMNFASIDGALSKVLSMNGKYYDWRTNEFPDKGLSEGRQIGVIAQEIEKILPEVVTTGDDGYKAVEYSHIVPVLIEAIKEQQKMIDGQNSTIADLKASLENVLSRVNIIEENDDIKSSKVEK